METRRRVLLVGEDDLSHGALARRLAGSLERQGLDVELRLVPEPNRLEARLVMFVPRLGAFDLQPLRWKLRYSARARGLLRRAAPRADVVLVNTQSCALLTRAIMRRVPVVLSVDATGRQFAGLQYWRPRTRGSWLADAALDRLERRTYGGARTIVAWSEWTARSLRDDYGVPHARIRVLHLGVDVPEAPAADPGRDGDRLRVLFVGNGVERKGLSTLLAARALASAAIDVDVVTGDPVEPAAGVTVHPGLAPGSPELARLYASAQAFALPSRADAVPWVVAEAMAAGLPVVAARTAAIPELVGDAGLLVEPGDAEGLAAALDRLAADPALRRDLGARAHAAARERFDEARQTVRLRDLLEEAAA